MDSCFCGTSLSESQLKGKPVAINPEERCNHVFCYFCIVKTLVEVQATVTSGNRETTFDKTSRCPLCRAIFDRVDVVEDFVPSNTTVENQVEFQESAASSVGNENIMAVKWVPYGRNIPSNAFAGGVEDGIALYIARGIYERDLLPGKLHSRNGILYVPWGGKSNALRGCEILVAPPGRLQWQTSSNGDVFQNAVIGGRTVDGEMLYIGRIPRNGNIVVGKIHPSHEVCYIPYDGIEVANKSYEILCESDSPAVEHRIME